MSKIIHATMYFRYGNHKRSDVKSETTFEAILKGERTSTTRFDTWRGIDRWNIVSPGDTIRFYEDKFMRGNFIDVVVESIDKISMSTFTEEQFEDWSKVEGWSIDYAKKIAKIGFATQIIYHLLTSQ